MPAEISPPAPLPQPADETPGSRANTPRHGSPAEFEQQARIMETVLSSIKDFAYSFDRDGRFIYVNRPLLNLWGLELKDAVGKNFFDLRYPDDVAAKLQRQITQVCETGRPVVDRTPYTNPSGATGYYEYIFTPVFGADGAVSIVAGSTRDISEQQTVLDALRRSQEQMAIVVKGANVGVWYCPLPFDKLIWDDKVKEHFHLDADAEVTIELFFERLHPEDRQRTREAIDASIAQKTPYDIDYRTVSPDGKSTKWIRAMGRGFYDAAGNPTRFDGITIDVTERVQAENRILEESHAIETINSVGRSVAAELDLGRLVQTVTDATTQLSGAQFGAFFYNVINERGESYSLYTISGVDKSHFEKFPMPRNTEVFAPTFRGEGVIRLDDVTADPRYGHNSPHHGMPKGHLPVRSYLAVPVVSRSGEVLGGLFYGHSDVGVFTQRAERIVTGIAAQAAVAIDNARLFEAARRANAEKDHLLESERAARSEAERASRMKDEFLATLSHELRTPLNAIFGWTQLLKQAKDDPETVSEGIDVIDRNVRMQTQLIEDLLDMSRIIAGKLRLDVQIVDPVQCIESAIETVMPAAMAKAIRVEKALDPRAGTISGDPGRLQQIIWNLLSNAIKFTPSGGKVQVALARMNAHLEISIADTGQGISAEFLPYVFDRFRQADAATTRKFGGLGLGLAIVKQIAEMHGGSIRVASGGIDKGSTFTLELPLAAVQFPRESPETLPSGAPAKMPPNRKHANLSGLCVVVVDDERDARELLRRVLEDCDARVHTAASAVEGLALVRAQRPDVLVTDIGMADVDGYEFLRRIRALAPADGGKIRAIALTAFARPEDKSRALLAGFSAHIAKPVEPAELVATIAAVVGRE